MSDQDSHDSGYKSNDAFVTYIEASVTLAESVKRNVVKAKNGVAVIDDKTVVALKEFMIAYNSIVDIYADLQSKVAKFN